MLSPPRSTGHITGPHRLVQGTAVKVTASFSTFTSPVRMGTITSLFWVELLLDLQQSILFWAEQLLNEPPLSQACHVSPWPTEQETECKRNQGLIVKLLCKVEHYTHMHIHTSSSFGQKFNNRPTAPGLCLVRVPPDTSLLSSGCSGRAGNMFNEPK